MFSLLLSRFGGYLAAAGALILAVLAALGMAKRSGKVEEQQAEKDKALEQGKESNEIDSKVRDSSDAAVADELHKYQRD